MGWDNAVSIASDEYKKRMVRVSKLLTNCHNLQGCYHKLEASTNLIAMSACPAYKKVKKS